MEESKFQMVRVSGTGYCCSRLQAEYRVSIYGRSASELPKLAEWFVANKMASKNVMWLIQIPRLLFADAAAAHRRG